jgi:hypothetical protein
MDLLVTRVAKPEYRRWTIESGGPAWPPGNLVQDMHGLIAPGYVADPCRELVRIPERLHLLLALLSFFRSPPQ